MQLNCVKGYVVFRFYVATLFFTITFSGNVRLNKGKIETNAQYIVFKLKHFGIKVMKRGSEEQNFVKLHC